MIFVFGSNTKGRHGRGAAQFAARYKGAVPGQGEGLQGECYALPTKDDRLKPLPLPVIAEHTRRLFAFAVANPQMEFQITRVGCGLAGNKDEEMLPLFEDAPSNCILPGRWLAMRNPSLARVIVAGTRSFDDYELMSSKLDRLLATLTDVEVVSGKAPGADTLGERYAKERSYLLKEFPADWKKYRNPAGHIRNTTMAWYATHLVAFWNGTSPGTRDMIRLAEKEGLQTRTIIYEPHSPK